jgi:hypothetical protein
MGADEFLAAHGGVLETLRKQLNFLWTYIQRLYFVDGDVNHVLLELLQMCVGGGHKECTKVLEEIKKHSPSHLGRLEDQKKTPNYHFCS